MGVRVRGRGRVIGCYMAAGVVAVEGVIGVKTGYRGTGL